MSDDRAQPKVTTLEHGTQLRGSLSSDAPVLLHGTIEGDVTVPSITITQSGRVVGQINAQELRSSGALEGQMTAESMYISGTVRDNSVLRARSLEVNPERRTDPEFVVFGNCTLEVGDEPALRPGAPDERAGRETSQSAQAASAAAARVVAEPEAPALAGRSAADAREPVAEVQPS